MKISNVLWLRFLTGFTLVSTTLSIALSTRAQEVHPSIEGIPDAIAQLPSEDAVTVSDVGGMLEQIQQYSNDTGSDSMSQVTNVAQFRDVQPTDWAYEALARIVERYGCLQGYPDGTFRGNRALSRYEFAAGLNACLAQIERLIGATPDSVPRAEFETLQRLLDEFRAEIGRIGGRFDALEGRTAFLEQRQFSTTTRLTGEAIFGIADAFGEGAGDAVSTVFHNRVRLNLLSSFTGRDRLRTRLQAGNAVPLLLNPAVPAAQRTNEGRFTYDGSNDGRNDNNILIDILDYRVPVTPNLAVNLFATGALHHHYADTVNPFFEAFGGGNNAVSRFAERNPIYRNVPGSAGVGINYNLTNALRLDLGYLSNTANNPNLGLFNGNYSALAQLVVGTGFKVGFTYIRGYENNPGPVRLNLAGTGTNLANLNTNALALATNLPAGTFNRPVESNSYGIQASLPLSPGFVVNGWVGKTEARLVGLGNADIWNFAVGLALPNLGRPGNLGGILVGAEPTLRGLEINGVQRNITRDFAYHIEGFYRYQLTDNISLTPGVVWLTSPNQNANNNDVVIGLLRTTFTF